MKVKDLFERDLEFIRHIYEEEYKDEKLHIDKYGKQFYYTSAESTLKIFKKVLEQNTNNDYEVSLNVNSFDYQVENYFFFTTEDNEEIYLLRISECSCGWDYNVENNWEIFVKNVLEEDLIILVDKLKYDLKQIKENINENN